MSIFAPTRLKTITLQLLPGNLTGVLLSTGSEQVAGTSIPYDARLHFLKGIGYIRSQPLTIVPVDNPTDSSLLAEMKAQQYEAAPKIGLQLTLKKPTNEEFWLAQPIPFYNNAGLHEVNISQVISDLTEFGIESGYSIIARAVDLGYGNLEGEDEIHVTGYASRSGEFLQDSQETIYTVS